MTPNLVYGTGFELNILPKNWDWAWSQGSGGSVAAGGIGGSYYLKLQGKYQGDINYRAATDGVAPGAELYLSFWEYHVASNYTIYIYLTDTNYLRITTNGLIWYGYINAALVATGIVNGPLNQWNHHQLHIVFDDSGTFDHKINGVMDFAYSGDTKPGTSVTLDHILWQSTGDNNWFYLDDFSICTGDWPGDLRFSGLLPASDVQQSGWWMNGLSNTAAPAACSAAVGAATGITGTYRYKVTLVDANGETLASVVSSPDITLANQKGSLSSIPTGAAGTTARKIYRNKNGGTTYYLLTTISDNITTTYTDSTADGSLPVTVEPANVLYNKLNDGSDATYVYTQADSQKYILGLDATWGDANKQPVAMMRITRAIKDSAISQRIILSEIYGANEDSSAEIELNTAALYYWRAINQLPGSVTITKENMVNLQLAVESKI